MNFYISALVVSNQDCNWEYLGQFGLFLLYCIEPKFKLRCAGMVGWQLQIFCLELLDVTQSCYVLVFIFQNHPEKKKTLGRILSRATNASESAVWICRWVNLGLDIVYARLLFQYGAGDCKKGYWYGWMRDFRWCLWQTLLHLGNELLVEKKLCWRNTVLHFKMHVTHFIIHFKNACPNVNYCF